MATSCHTPTRNTDNSTEVLEVKYSEERSIRCHSQEVEMATSCRTPTRNTDNPTSMVNVVLNEPISGAYQNRPQRQRKVFHPRTKPIRQSQNKLVVYYTNADVLSNKFNILLLEVDRINPDIIAVTEVKPKNSRYSLQPSEVNRGIYPAPQSHRSGEGYMCLHK